VNTTDTTQEQVDRLVHDTEGIESGFVRSLKVAQLVKRRGLSQAVYEAAIAEIERQAK